MKGEYVYVFKAINYPFIKVGYSNDPDKRRKNLQQNTPFKLAEWKRIRGTTKEEKKIHLLLRNCFRPYVRQSRGEWYKILFNNESKVRDIIDKIFLNFKDLEVMKKYKEFTDIQEFKLAIRGLIDMNGVPND